MYVRWAEAHGMKVDLIAESPGEEAGIRSATYQVKGLNAYGWLKSESGVHRLVRISPFDSAAQRHTSFSSVWVYPVVDDNIEIEVNPSDIRIDTYRSSGAGGQHVNTTDSAVRITHLPTGIMVVSAEKSQHQNRAKAMQILRARLYDMERTKAADERSEARRLQVGSGDRSERIRTYNFPQGRLTDHRINLTLYKLDRVMVGDLDEIIDSLTADHQSKLLADVGAN
jgi:peptide chain release factor 1